MGFFDRRAIRKYEREADKVLKFEATMAAKTDDELRAKTQEFKDRLAKGETLDDIKYEAFAVAREAAKRTIGEFPFKVQVIGSLVIVSYSKRVLAIKSRSSLFSFIIFLVLL